MKLEIGDVFKTNELSGKVINVVKDNVTIIWGDYSPQVWSLEELIIYIKQGEMKLCTYAQSPLWKKLEVIK